MSKIEASHAPRAQALRALRTAIRSGSWGPGDVLPSERDLADSLAINRGAVRWALAALEAEGLTQNNGPRTRMVTHGASRLADGADPLMSNVVAVISAPPPAMDEPPDLPELRGWLSAVVRGCLHGLAREGLHPLLVNPEHVCKHSSQGVASLPLGALLPEIKTEPIAGPLACTGWLARVPAVAYGGHPALAAVDRVVSDHEQGAYLLAQWLVRQGRRRLVEVWPSEGGYWLEARHAGHVRALREAGLEPVEAARCPSFLRPPDSAETFERESRAFAGSLVDRLVGDASADAFLVHSDGDVSRVAAACRLCGREPNRDVWLAGYDNYAAALRSEPFTVALPLATVDKRNFAAGEAMVRLLAERIAGKLPSDPQVRVLAPELVVLNPSGERH